MAGIELIEEFRRGNKYSPSSLRAEYQFLRDKFGLEQLNFKKPSRMADPDGIKFGSGSLYDRATNTFTKRQEMFNCWCDFVHTVPTYYDLVVDVTLFAAVNYNLNVGRVRLITLPAKMCLTYHIDRESEIRLHVPIITNDNVMFIVDDRVERMSEEGRLYSLDVQKKHTVVNASRQDRVHLVFDLYR